MRLTTYSDYAFRTLLYLGARPDQVVSVGAIAETFGLSSHHLAKVAQTLARAGYLHTQRGPSGGLQLGRPADEIRLGDVLRRTEPDFNLVECFDQKENDCPLAGACKLQDIMGQAMRAFLEVFDCYTLADLLRSRALRLRLLPR